MTKIETLASILQANTQPGVDFTVLSDQEVADWFNDTTRQVTVDFLTGQQIGALVDLTEFDALPANSGDRDVLSRMWSLDRIPTAAGTFFRQWLLDRFPNGTTTFDNLTSAFTETISPASEYGLGVVRATDVLKARAL